MDVAYVALEVAHNLAVRELRSVDFFAMLMQETPLGAPRRHASYDNHTASTLEDDDRD